jgi:DNA (cytosine-5)-methyltransferase 1
MLTVGSMFSGIGGLDLGLERAGMTIVWQAENDPYCCRVLARHWPHVPNLGDVTHIDWTEVPRVDLIAGGFPCQPLAQNGHRLGRDDPRWLWPWMRDAVCHLRPPFVLVENVADLVVRGLDDVLGDLAACWYDAEWQSIPAAAAGAPHRRERTFVVAYPHGERRQAARVLSRRPAPHLGEAGPWQSLPRRGAGGRVRPFPEPGVLRVAHGIPSGLDGPRLRALGNAVVPQVAEHIGRLIVEAA